MQMYLLLTEQCNLNCSFCIRGKRKNNKFLSVENLTTVLENNDFSKYHLMITGGEPTLHQNLPQIIDLCINHFKGVSINTNGIESKWISETKSKNFHVQISIDGTKDIHNNLRGNGTFDVFDKIMQTIKILNENKISYNISTTVSKINYENIKQLNAEISKFENLKYWKVSAELPFGCATPENMLSIDEWNKLVEWLLDNSRVFLKINKLFDFKLLDKYMQEHKGKIDSHKTNCGNVKYKIYVYPDFTVYPCTCLTDFRLGNLLEENLPEILANDESKKFIEYKVLSDSKCSNCKYVSICNGGCIGMSYKFFKKLGMGDYRCPLMKK